MTEPAPASPEAVAAASAAAMWAEDAASRALGMRLEQVRPGYARISMAVRPDMVNGHDICHGGLVFTLADSTFAFACNSAGVRTVAQGAEVVFVAPARRGDRLVAEAVERTRYGRNGVYDVTVRRVGTGEVVAEFRGRSRQVAGSLLPGPGTVPTDGKGSPHE